MAEFQRIRVIDSHTGGEPTRLVIGGGPDLGRGSMAERFGHLQLHLSLTHTDTIAMAVVVAEEF